MTRYYVGIDLHSNNNHLCVINQDDQVQKSQKLKNDLAEVLFHLGRFKEDVVGVVVESTYNWYWLVDGLIEAGYQLHLANPAANIQYKGLKYTDDKSDARWLANLLRLRILEQGYIYPKEERALRDLLRRRSQLVRLRTTNILSIQNQIIRNSAQILDKDQVLKLDEKKIRSYVSLEDQVLSIRSNLNIVHALNEQIQQIEKVVLKKGKLKPSFKKLMSIDGIGKILALTIMLETGDINRFSKVGHFASYSRCVGSKRTSNEKKKGSGNRKNGNKYLSWAFVEGANYLIRYNDKAKRFYERKVKKTKSVVARKALAHKLARASFFIMRDQCLFDENLMFSGA